MSEDDTSWNVRDSECRQSRGAAVAVADGRETRCSEVKDYRRAKMLVQINAVALLDRKVSDDVEDLKEVMA